MKKALVLFLAVSVFALGCGDDAGSSGIDPQLAASLNSKSYSAVSTALATAYSQAMMPTGSYSFNYNQNGLAITGAINYNDSTGEADYTATIAFDNYTATDVVLDGNATVSYVGSSTSFTYQYRGTFTATYQGTAYTMGWTIDIGFNGSAYSYTGNYSVNGQSFNYSGSGSV